jgi:hypothetical protein
MEAVHAYEDDDACYVLVYMVLVLWQHIMIEELDQLELAELAGSVYEAVKWQRISDAHHRRPHERIS